MLYVSHRDKVEKEQRREAALAALDSIPEVTATPAATATPVPTATPTPSLTPVPTILPAFEPENYQGIWCSEDGLTTIDIYDISLKSVSFTYKRVNGKDPSMTAEADVTAEVAGNATQFRFKDSEGNKAKGEFVFDKSGELYVKVKTYERGDGSLTYPKTESIMTRQESSLEVSENSEEDAFYNESNENSYEQESYSESSEDSSDENTVIKNLLTPEKGAYNQILWILDNAYIPGTTNKEEYLKKFNAVYDVAVGDTLTDEDIIAIQKMVIWYFTNYIIHDDITYNPSNRWEIYNQTDSETGSWLKITNDNWATQASIGEGNNENRRKYESDLLYKNLIKAANDGASEYNTTRTPVSINTNGLTKVADNKYKISIKKVGEYYVLGPIKLNGTNNVNSSITLKTTDKNGNEITDYKISDSEGNEQNKTINDYIGNEDGFYIKVSSTNGKTIKISLNITNSGTKKTLWLKGTETDTKITLAGEQPLVEITRAPETIETELTAEYTEFDLALRKYIIEINGRKLTDINLQSRNPKIDESTLKTGTTATYKHRKAPVEVKENDVVTYSITIYNEGDIDGYASKIVDQLPTGLIVSPENPETVTSIGKDGNAKNKYTITKGLPTVPTTEAPANSIVFNIVNTTENPAQSLKAYSETNGLDYETLTFKCIVKQEPDTKNDKILKKLTKNSCKK